MSSEEEADECGDGAGGVGGGARPSKGSAGKVQAGQPKSASASKTSADDPRQLQFPAEVWGHILDYMFYEEVRSALRICKTVANDAVKHVQTITIMKSSQLDVPAARRFPNVRELNIFSLLLENPRSQQSSGSMCADTAKRSALFAISFPNLAKICLGDLRQNKNDGYWYTGIYRGNIGGPSSHRLLFRGLIEMFCAAFKSRSLLNIVATRGILDAHDVVRPCKYGLSEEELCCCRDVCTFFPIPEVCDLDTVHKGEYTIYNGVCLSSAELLRLVSARSEWKDCVKGASIAMLLKFLFWSPYIEFNKETATGAGLEFCESIFDLESDRFEVMVHHLEPEDFEDIDAMLAFGLDPRHISKEKLHKALWLDDFWAPREVWTKSAYQGLIERGFPIDDDNFIIVDEKTHPALKGRRFSRVQSEEPYES